MKKWIDMSKLYSNEIEVVSVVDLKIKSVDINNNVKEQVISLDLYDYQDICSDTDIISDCVGRVELAIDSMNYDLVQYLRYNKTDLNYIGFIFEILENMGEEIEYKEVKIVEVVDIEFKFENFNIALDKISL